MSYERRGTRRTRGLQGLGLDYSSKVLLDVDTGKTIAGGGTMKSVLYLPPKQPSPPIDAVRDVGTKASGLPVAWVAADKAPVPIASDMTKSVSVVDKAVDLVKGLVSSVSKLPATPPTCASAPCPDGSCALLLMPKPADAPSMYKCPGGVYVDKDGKRVYATPPSSDKSGSSDDSIAAAECLSKGMVYDPATKMCVRQAQSQDAGKTNGGNGKVTTCDPKMEANSIPSNAPAAILDAAKAFGCQNVSGDLWCCPPGTDLAGALKGSGGGGDAYTGCPAGTVPDGYGGCVEAAIEVGPNGVANGEAAPAAPVCPQGTAYDVMRNVCVAQVAAASAAPSGLAAVPRWAWVGAAGVVGLVLWKRSQGKAAPAASTAKSNRSRSDQKRIWLVLDPSTNLMTQRGPQVSRPREHARAVVVDSWPESDPMPIRHDAEEWDAWRLRRGISGERNPRDTIKLDRRIALKMLNWHSSGGDPIYAAGSYGLSGLPVKRDVAERALANFEREIAQPHHSWTAADLRELRQIIGHIERKLARA